MAVYGLPTIRRTTPSGTPWLVGTAVTCWVLVGTMRYWWSWLWRLLGLVSVPVDMVVWIVPIVVTILLAPRLWHRFRHAWLIAVAVGAVFVGETADVLSPWHEVLAKAVAAAFT